MDHLLEIKIQDAFRKILNMTTERRQRAQAYTWYISGATDWIFKLFYQSVTRLKAPHLKVPGVRRHVIIKQGFTFLSNNFLIYGFHQCSLMPLASITSPSCLVQSKDRIQGTSVPPLYWAKFSGKPSNSGLRRSLLLCKALA